ncbi:MAG: response regulator transcription factor [Aureliella sp.]
MLNEAEYERRILIIDDNQSIHDDFRRVLLSSDDNSELAELEAACFGDSISQDKAPSLNLTLTHALQGEEGVAYARDAFDSNAPFDLAFVDMRMPPGWDGLYTIQELWKVDPDLEVVICTAYSDHTWNEIVAEVGHNHHLLILKKPFEVVEIQQMALGLTEKRRMSRLASLKMDELKELVVEQTHHLREDKLNVEAMLRDIVDLVSPEASRQVRELLAR